ncbi:D-alanyl-D-alanine carboxypeptidase/D-alanyl-D-alanine-endopeptidase [Methylotenera sp.]|uniref:D-alanyl-D-alanine carboxypeptidase/D-alanyl-D-alanine endopeptidase n=1 Tax=Methylotenera sp. TaxID=2051956 RepID=UPI0024888EE3|nr:D-alanyl-D-alanine carboxypeptidase/D-alanyl-D-alanine-endopeptidase [Methylotenera sp.]MDI1299869.1 D-alanyl-D-alanine carboxypeptidase/D-alanyl-D-alanine-endopeptidase [Methylotenera sp.]
MFFVIDLLKGLLSLTCKSSGQFKSLPKVTLVLLLLSFTAHAELPSTVADALKAAGIPAKNVAVYVQSVESNSPALSHNADKSMNPASVMKLVTTNAALDLLTPAYRWKTEVYRDSDVVNGVLQGNLIIKGYGDPSFKAQDFWRMLMSVQQAGIKEIKGDLIIDTSYFIKNIANKKAFDDETWRAYNAEPSAFLVNGRSTSFKFNATDTSVNINQEFELNEIQIVNNMKLVQGPCGEWRSRFGYVVKPNASGATVTFSGTFSPDCGERYLELSVFDDEKYAFYTFKKLWKELGGKFSGQLKIQDTPMSAVKVLEQLSDPLAYVVRDINKWSNNLMARQLLLTLAAEKLTAPATELNGAAVLKNWLADKGSKFDELVIENGSGLSRIERISAEHLGKMLVSTYNSPVMPEFMASLPILALDGTVKKRLNDSQSNGRAHLKTGSLDGVSAIAGYVLDANNHRHVLVMLVNHPKASASRNAQDALIEWVHQQP